jgi:hypothetical protein
MDVTISLEEDVKEEFLELRKAFPSDKEFVSFLLEAASFYSGSGLSQVLEDMNERIRTLEESKKTEGKPVKFVNGRVIGYS